jgi:hypothetical protein
MNESALESKRRPRLANGEAPVRSLESALPKIGEEYREV